MKSPNKNMTVIRKYDEKDREQIIELWKTCNLTRPWNDPNKDFDTIVVEVFVFSSIFLVNRILIHENRIGMTQDLSQDRLSNHCGLGDDLAFC